MKALESRKQLLIAESELNRAHLIHELQTMAGDVHALANQAKTISSIASGVAGLIAGLSSLRHKKSSSGAEKPSWWQTILKGAEAVRSFWSQFRSQDRA
jgi:hypothetical protein